MPLYTEEQLSMILSAHAGDLLVRKGSFDFGLNLCDGRGCINQVAFNEPNNAKAIDYGGLAERAARWFDENYSPMMPASRLLRKLESF